MGRQRFGSFLKGHRKEEILHKGTREVGDKIPSWLSESGSQCVQRWACSLWGQGPGGHSFLGQLACLGWWGWQWGQSTPPSPGLQGKASGPQEARRGPVWLPSAHLSQLPWGGAGGLEGGWPSAPLPPSSQGIAELFSPPTSRASGEVFFAIKCRLQLSRGAPRTPLRVAGRDGPQPSGLCPGVCDRLASGTAAAQLHCGGQALPAAVNGLGILVQLSDPWIAE